MADRWTEILADREHPLSLPQIAQKVGTG